MNNREAFINSLKINPKPIIKGAHTSNKSFKNVGPKIAAFAMSVAVLLGASACSKRNEPTPTLDNSSTAVTQPIIDEPRFTSGEEVMKNFLKIFANEYNKKNGTDIDANSIELYCSYPDYIYKTFDGQYITHGSLPYETEKKLKDYGDFSQITPGALYQILNKYSEEIVDASTDSGHYFHSGNRLDTLLEDLADNNPSVLGELVELAERANLCVQPNAKQGDFNNYEDALKEYEKSQIENDDLEK